MTNSKYGNVVVAENKVVSAAKDLFDNDTPDYIDPLRAAIAAYDEAVLALAKARALGAVDAECPDEDCDDTIKDNS